MGFPAQQQEVSGVQSAMDPVPDCGEKSYRGSGRMAGKRAVITGGDSGIGRAVAIAFAREGADILISYLDEDDDAAEVARLSLDAGAIRCDEGRDRQLLSQPGPTVGRRGIRVNSVAPGPIWTPLIPAAMPEEKVANLVTTHRSTARANPLSWRPYT